MATAALQILHLEDNQADAALVEALLQSEGITSRVVCVKTRAEYEAALERGDFDVILSDYSLPQFDGLSALALAREKHPDKPLIFVSGTMGEEAAVESLKQGATDYVLKDHLARLPSAVRRAVAEAQELALRQQAEETVREQAALLDKAQDAILVRDLEDRILYWNKSAERMYGWTAEEALGKKADELLYNGEANPLQLANQVVLQKGEWQGEIQQVTREGKTITVQSRWSLVRDKAGEPKSKLIINTDVTERRQLEAQFRRAQRLETIGALTGGIAHDLNNILMPILLGSQFLAKEVSSQSGRSMLETMRSSAVRGSEMINQILAFARGVGGKPAILDVSHLLRELEKLTRETFPRIIRMEVITPPELHPVMGNATQLHQVLLNLCINARDAMPGGGHLQLQAENVQLEQTSIRLEPEPVSGPFVLLTVADTGHGIAPEVLDRIFEPFFTTKEPGKGTGLGLSTVQGIVKSHGGFLEVTSKVGEGTTFRVYLPAHQNENAPSA
jgi:two-component system cell cycle sensor histidine kinase/response regulator CckA